MYLKIEGINKSFTNDQNEKVKVLDNISMEIEKGSFVSIVGPSGCGKSTLLDVIAGLEKADSGFISVSGKKINKPGPDRVVVFQEDGLFPWLTVLDNVMYGLHLKKNFKNRCRKESERNIKNGPFKSVYPLLPTSTFWWNETKSSNCKSPCHGARYFTDG